MGCVQSATTHHPILLKKGNNNNKTKKKQSKKTKKHKVWLRCRLLGPWGGVNPFSLRVFGPKRVRVFGPKRAKTRAKRGCPCCGSGGQTLGNDARVVRTAVPCFLERAQPPGRCRLVVGGWPDHNWQEGRGSKLINNKKTWLKWLRRHSLPLELPHLSAVFERRRRALAAAPPSSLSILFPLYNDI